MARIGLVIAIWMVFVGGLGLYMRQRDAGASEGPTVIRLETAAGQYAVEVTPSFAAAPDPFALQIDEQDAGAALVVRLGEREILRVTDHVEGGKPLRIEDVEGVVVGMNEVLVEASPPTDQADRRHFVLLRVLRDEAAIAERTFWSEGGAKVAGSLRFEIAAGDREGAHEH